MIQIWHLCVQVGKDGCKRGVCTLHVSCEDMTVEFQHLGIQCVRKKDIEESLRQRKDIRVDPFKQGFKHLENPTSIDLNAVKLCFQVFKPFLIFFYLIFPLISGLFRGP